MAHTWTDTGLSALLAHWPRSAFNTSGVFYIGYFGSQTSGTVPNRTAFGGATPGGWVESVAMPRMVVSAGQWGVPASNGNGYRVTALQLASTATAAGSANGFFLGTHVSSVAADLSYFFANFDDLTQVGYNSGDVIRITPAVQFNVSALS